MTDIYSLIPLLFMASLWTFGVHCLLSQGFLLEPMGNFLERKLSKWICKPLFTCPPCMASFHGVVVFFTGNAWFGLGLHWYLVFIFVVALAGLNYIIGELIDK